MSGLTDSLRVLALTFAVADAGAEYAIFGSTTLKLRGIIERDPGDVDVFVSRRVWGLILPQHGWHVETPGVGDPPVLCYPLTAHPLHLFFDWRDVAVDIDVKAALAAADYAGAWRCCTVDEVLRQKRAAFAWGTAATVKHGPDIAAVEDWLGRRR